MRVLLDSQVFLWMTGESWRVPDRVRQELNLAEELYLSVVSEWELTIKHQIGKLELPRALSEIVRLQCDANGLRILPVVRDHVHQYSTLPLHHRDPFDRMLIAQAIAEDLTVVTADALFKHYPVKTAW